jgi:hypothetical protein
MISPFISLEIMFKTIPEIAIISILSGVIGVLLFIYEIVIKKEFKIPLICIPLLIICFSILGINYYFLSSVEGIVVTKQESVKSSLEWKMYYPFEIYSKHFPIRFVVTNLGNVKISKVESSLSSDSIRCPMVVFDEIYRVEEKTVECYVESNITRGTYKATITVKVYPYNFKIFEDTRTVNFKISINFPTSVVESSRVEKMFNITQTSINWELSEEKEKQLKPLLIIVIFISIAIGVAIALEKRSSS